MKTLVLGIGNTIRGNDGVGIEVARRLREVLTREQRAENREQINIKETDEAGFNLLLLMFGYKRVIIVDSIQSKDAKAGNIHCLSKRDLNLPAHLQFSHNTGIPGVLAWAERAKVPLPDEVIFYVVEIAKSDNFAEGLSRELKDAIPKVVDLIKRHIC